MFRLCVARRACPGGLFVAYFQCIVMAMMQRELKDDEAYICSMYHLTPDNAARAVTRAVLRLIGLENHLNPEWLFEVFVPDKFENRCGGSR